MTGSIETSALGLLENALEQPSGERVAWIASQPADAAVKARAIALLTTAQPSSLRTGGGLADTLFAEPPERVGAYRITGLIGQGGMGAVYRGERITGDFDHAVAIKLIRPGALSDALKQRFLDERSTLASLSHPGIARLFDGGETDLGEPYIVMELVDGVALDRWLDDQPSKEARTTLALALCAAVGFAHQNLVVHRDITPSNILVIEDGAPKLIDFGIARPPADPSLGGGGSRSLAGLSLTPGFAAPERVAGAAATTLGDIYSLGKIIDCLFPAPRDADVDAIVARAIATDPQDRYATTAALAADIAAWRDARPVAARNGGNRYVLSRFVRRNRTAVAASAAALALLIGAFAATGWSYARAESARAAEAQRFGEVRSLANYLLFDLNDQLATVSGNTLARARLAEQASRYLAILAASAGNDRRLALETVDGYIRLARIHGVPTEPNLGNHARARADLAAARRLLATDGIGSGATDPAIVTRGAVIDALEGVILLQGEGQQETAEPLIARSDAALDRIPAADRSVMWHLARRDVRRAELELADISGEPAAIFKAASALEADMAARPTALAPRYAQIDGAFLIYFRALATSFENPSAAVDLNLQAEPLFDRLVAESGGSPDMLSAAAWNAYDGFGSASQSGREDISNRLIVRAAALVDRAAAIDENDNTLIALALNIREALAQNHRDLDRFDQAVALQRSVVERRRAFVESTPSARNKGNLAFSTMIMGLIHKDSGNRAAACAAWRESLPLFTGLQSRREILGFHEAFIPGIARNVQACATGAAFGPLR